MKVSKSNSRLLAGLSMAASLFWACDLSNPSRDSVTDNQPTELRLKIEDNPGCLEKWEAIQLSRVDGKGGFASEEDFLANCMKEIKDGAGKVPADLVPDSASRCHWIEVQSDGGRKDLEVAYKQYCAGEDIIERKKPESIEGKPEVSEGKPEVIEGKPGVSEGKPDVIKEKPVQAETKPEPAKEKPVYTEDVPDPTEPKPELLKQKLAEIGETTPAKIQEKPEHIDDKPIVIYEKPVGK